MAAPSVTRESGVDDPALTAPTPTSALTERIERLAGQARRSGIDAMVIGPGADLRYFVGHSVSSHERLTCLVAGADGTARLLVPALERPGWTGTPVEDLGLEIITWRDGHDPYSVVAALVQGAAVLGVDDHLPAVHMLGLQAAVPGSDMALAGPAIAELRMRKDDAEVAALTAVGAAVDRVHGRMPEWLRAGRTEREVAADIAAGMVEEGHARADFVIVGSGPNGASPHHAASDRTIKVGDSVVVDIGGPSPAGYFSDCTRSYVVGGPADPELGVVHEVVRQAQAAGVAAVVASGSCESVDAASRGVITDAGYGEYFITRTGHGIGLEVHEHPYMVSGNSRILEPGMAFSVEPGIYLPGRFGVRIEDIVVVGADGQPLLLNNASTEQLAMPAARDGGMA